MHPTDFHPVSAQTDAQTLPLVIVSPSGERRKVLVDRSPFRIGRLPDRELTLKDGRISRDHAQILLEDGQYFIEDLNSRHGVFVNGRRSERAPLKRRDRIDFGIEDSYQIYVGDAPANYQTPLLQKVAALPGAPESAGNLTRLSAVLDVARILESSGNVEDVLGAAVDAALAVTNAERGFLMLKNADGELEIRVARDDEGQGLAEKDLQIPRTVIAEALAQRDDLFAMSFDPSIERDRNPGQTVVALQLRSVVCVPLLKIRLGQAAETRVLTTKQDTIGVLYMDTRRFAANLAEGNQEVLQTLAIEISSVLENARLLDEERKKHQLEQELSIARDIQQALLPPAMPSEGWFLAAGSSQACFQVGGDYFDLIEIAPDRWGVVLVDVSGKGVSAALLTSLLQGAFFSAAAGSHSLSESVARINKYVSARSRHARFATAFCAVIRDDGVVTWLNAGHCAGLLARASGEIEWLEPTSCPIGLFEEAEYPSQQVQLKPKDRLVLYSDGVSEAASFSNDRYGEQRLGDFVRANVALRPAELHRRLIDEVSAFTQGAEQADDLTLLILGYER